MTSHQEYWRDTVQSIASACQVASYSAMGIQDGMLAGASKSRKSYTLVKGSFQIIQHMLLGVN